MATKVITGYSLGYFPCDSCGAKSVDAWYKARTGQLFTFCSHHTFAHYALLTEKRFKIIMTRAT